MTVKELVYLLSNPDIQELEIYVDNRSYFEEIQSVELVEKGQDRIISLDTCGGYIQRLYKWEVNFNEKISISNTVKRKKRKIN